MALTNGMQGSETLNSTIFQGGAPTEYVLKEKIDAMLAQYSPEIVQNQKAQEVLGRIESLSQAVASRGEGTRADLVKLYMETIAKNRMAQYGEKVLKIELQHKEDISRILGASNDGNFSQAA